MGRLSPDVAGAVVAVAVILGLAASKVVDLFTADPQVGHWRTQEARSAYERAYRDVLAGLPAPDVTREVKTDYGIVHALVWNGPDDAGAPVLLMPGRSSGAPMWAENLPSWIGQRTVIALDPIGDPGLSAQSMPLGEPADQGAWVSQAIDGLGMNTVHVVGHSFGGATATELALAHPEQVAYLTLLEPIMAVEVVTPEEYLGSVIGDLNGRRGMIQGQDMRGNATVVNAFVPLANMFGYVNTLRGMSQGRAQFTMQYDHYEPVPQHVADEVIKKYA